MLNFTQLKKGEILSETSYFIVENVTNIDAELSDSHGNNISIGKEYLEKLLHSADQFIDEKKVSQTELLEVIATNPNKAMSIYFKKADKKKTIKAFKEEKEDKIKEIQNASLNNATKLLEELIDNPILKVIPGEMRLIKGYYTGSQDERGRYSFADMEDKKGLLKQVDPRTVEYVIVGNTKWIKK